jgi:hypothetical protein
MKSTGLVLNTSTTPKALNVLTLRRFHIQVFRTWETNIFVSVDFIYGYSHSELLALWYK